MNFYIQSYLHVNELINNLKDSSDTWKFYLFTDIIYRLSKDDGKKRKRILSINIVVMIKDSKMNQINAIFRALFINYEENMI